MSLHSGSSEYRALASNHNLKHEIPKFSYDLRDHKKGIAINWTIIIITSGILPIALYFALRYGAKLQLSIVLALTSALFGVLSLFSLSKRTWDLTKKNSKCRPLGAGRWAMDYFNFNFLVAFVAITAVNVVGNITLSVRLVALGLPILIAEVCAQLLVFAVLARLQVRIPFRVSSVAAGTTGPSGVYSLVEDIIAVDGGQGRSYRQQLMDRYKASKTVRSLYHEMDLLWGISGTVIGIGTIALIFVLPDEDLAYALGWAIPWFFAAVVTVLTIVICKLRLRHELADGSYLGAFAA